MNTLYCAYYGRCLVKTNPPVNGSDYCYVSFFHHISDGRWLLQENGHSTHGRTFIFKSMKSFCFTAEKSIDNQFDGVKNWTARWRIGVCQPRMDTG
ncbi:Hypothetical protein CINCED_3A005851 [Cinara cedri]|uniref:Uncharacterized protein n=1 Tax=Cinara cedri TaxID=506608 RepID=A0A5E4NMH0_9HEMI|nr:Hypothetical protein CINCED_3A005851 [Cinara cedri]